MKRRMFFGLALIVCGESFSLLDAFVILLLVRQCVMLSFPPVLSGYLITTRFLF